MVSVYGQHIDEPYRIDEQKIVWEVVKNAEFYNLFNKTL